jgi:hypothetical protein
VDKGWEEKEKDLEAGRRREKKDNEGEGRRGM